MPGVLTVNALALVPFLFPGLLTTTLNTPAITPLSGNVLAILVVENDATVPLAEVEPLFRNIGAPVRNFFPEIVTDAVLTLYAEAG